MKTMESLMPWIKFALLLAFPFVGLAVVDKAQSLGWLSPHCPECHAALKVETKTLREPTAEAPGLGLSVRTCPQCGYREEKQFVIDKYEGTTRGVSIFGGVLRWKRESWKAVTKETLERSERDSDSRKHKA